MRILKISVDGDHDAKNERGLLRAALTQEGERFLNRFLLYLLNPNPRCTIHRFLPSFSKTKRFIQ